MDPIIHRIIVRPLKANHHKPVHRDLLDIGYVTESDGYLYPTRRGMRWAFSHPSEVSARHLASLAGFHLQKVAFGRRVPWSTRVTGAVMYEMTHRNGDVEFYSTLEAAMEVALNVWKV